MTVRILAGLLLLLPLVCLGGARAEPASSVLVRTTPLSTHDLTETLTAYGRVEPAPDHLIAVALPHAGIIQHLWVSLGERIDSGQKLLEVATSPNEQMSYQQAEAALNFSKAKLARQESLFEQHLATRNDVDAARRALDDARARLEALRGRGADRKTQVVRAPVAGIVAKVDVNQGDRVKADTGALLLATGHALIVPLGVEPEDARRIEPGAQVVLTSPFQPNVHVRATVGSVHAMVNPTTRLLDVIVAVPESATSQLVLGSAIQGRIILESRKALAVPRQAVLSDSRGPYLFLVENGRARRIDVSTGISDHGLLEVSAPELKEGQEVVTLGNYELEDGTAVRESSR